MPGRVASSTSRVSATASKARVTRTTSPTTNIPDEGPATTLREQVCTIFTEAYRTTTGTRKLVVSLRKIQELCCYEPTKPRKNAIPEDFDEDEFSAEIVRCAIRILPIKKSEAAGDRLIRFLGLFLKHATDNDNAIFQEADPMQGVPETPSSRLTTRIISTILPLLPAKDKVVRFRSTQIVAHLINTLDSIDDELFHPVRLGLLRRLRDKESNVRVQAVYGLGRLAGEADMEMDDEDSDADSPDGGVLAKLLDVLQNDPSADVRRSLLLNLPFTPSTLPFLLERARDSDAATRRALYSRLLPALGDFRHLSLTHREKLLRWGLRDRDEAVKKATARLFRERWIENCAIPRDENGEPVVLPAGQIAEPSLAGLLELLERIDVVNAGGDGGIALDAMKAFWNGRPDYQNYITFNEDYWNQLTPESAFVARTFNDFCREDDAPDSLREKMPEVTRFAFLLQQNINMLVETVRRTALQEDAEEDSAQQEFIVEQLLRIALTLDYSDEVGRRTMFSLMREALAIAELPEESTRLVVEVLHAACGTHAVADRDFAGIVLEAIAEVHDTIMGEETTKMEEEIDDSFHSARSEISGESTPRGRPKQNTDEEDEEKAIREIMVNMKCLHIAQCMLQNVDCSLEQNAHLVTMLNNLVIPAVRSQEAPIRERGLLCLGLCCLLDKNLAEENLTLFLHCFTKGHDALQNIAIQIIGDILGAHPSLLAVPAQPENGEENEAQEHPFHKPIYKLFSRALKSPTASIQSTACTALCKLMLSSPSMAASGNASILNNDDFLRLLTMAYFDPETAGNPALRQSLSYFLPVYCHSRKENMQRMGRIATSILNWCISIKEEMDVEGEEDAMSDMVGLSVVIAHLVDWTDSRKLAAALSNLGDFENAEDDGDVHLDWALELLDKVLGVCSKDERKLFISVLGKLNYSPSGPNEKLEEILRLITEAVEEKVAGDTASRNALNKVQVALSKAITGAQGGGRSHSRAVSLAPSVADEGEESRIKDAASEIDATEVDDNTVMAPPVQAAVSSPRKHAGRPSKARQALPPPSDMEATTDIASVLPKLSLVDRSRPQPQSREEVEDDEDDEPTPQPTRQQRINKGRPQEVEEESVLETTELDVPEPAIMPVQIKTEPAKKPRGRPPKSSLAPVRQLPLVDEESVLENEENEEPIEAAAEEPVKKPRGRPPKSASTTVAPEVGGGRRSVRAGRKRVSEV